MRRDKSYAEYFVNIVDWVVAVCTFLAFNAAVVLILSINAAKYDDKLVITATN